MRLAGAGAPPEISVTLLKQTSTLEETFLEPKYVTLADPSIGEIIPMADGTQFVLIEPMRPFRVAVPRPPDVLRVAVLGSSPPYGLRDSVPASTYLRDKLADRVRPRRVEIVDLTNRRMNLEMMRLLVPDVRTLQPQAAIVYLSGAWPQLAPPPATPATPPTALRKLMERSVLFRLLRDWFSPRLAHAARDRAYLPKPREFPGVREQRRADVVRHANRVMRQTRDAQIIAIATELRAAGVEVLFVGPLVNVTRFRPLLSMHSDDLSTDELAAFLQHYSRGCTMADGGDCTAALPSFENAAVLDSGFANLHFRMALCYLDLGNQGAAEKAFFDAQRYDLSPERAALAPGREPIDAVETLGAHYLDPYMTRRAETVSSLPPQEWFVDLIHLTDEGQKILSQAVTDKLVTIIGNN
ncbi:MAG: hypothetical protein P9L99_21485 [Candidatus Lernaella stagnicola]|nr:hypothetical protein [Candidatus Lernaella stagnicola]